MNQADAFEAVIGYQFNNTKLLQQALTHRSVCAENNERLEYLGDSILCFFVAELLYRHFEDQQEGELTKMRARLVRRETLAELARKLQIQTYLHTGKSGQKNSIHHGDSVLAGTFEAVLGALYLDRGIGVTEIFLYRLYAPLVAELQPGTMQDNKSKLQEVLQKDGLPLPMYTIILQQGAAHNRLFTVSCQVAEDHSFIATGKSRKTAEQAAAELALQALFTHVD